MSDAQQAIMRIYYEAHINRLRSICCFKRTGMFIAQLKDFFSLEKDEENSIDDMIELLELQEKSVEDKLKELHADYDNLRFNRIYLPQR